MNLIQQLHWENSLKMFMTDGRKERKDLAVREAKERHQVRSNEAGAARV